MKNERGIKMVILYEVHDNLYVNMTEQMSVRVHILSKTDEGRNESFGHVFGLKENRVLKK